MLTRIDSETVLNLDAVASVRFSRESDELTATVWFLAAATDGFSETLLGESAQKLYNLLGGDNEGPITSPAFSPPNQSPSGAPAEIDRPIPFQVVTIRQAFSRTKGWYYYRGPEDKGYFIAFVNAKGSCTMRTFDANTGRFMGMEGRAGNYQEQFSYYIQNATELIINSQPNLARDCRERLPEGTLSYLKTQVTAS